MARNSHLKETCVRLSRGRCCADKHCMRIRIASEWRLCLRTHSSCFCCDCNIVSELACDSYWDGAENRTWMLVVCDPKGHLKHNKSKTEHTLNRKPKTALLQLEAVFLCSLGFESLILSFSDGKGWFQSQTQSAFWVQTSSETDPENCRRVCTVGPTRPSEGHFPVSLWWPRLAAHTSSCISVLLRT